MEHESLLQTIAQVAATFGGLAAVTGAFKGTSDVTKSNWIVRDVVEISILVSLLTFTPFIVHLFGMSEEASWRISCVVALLIMAMGFAGTLRRSWVHWRSNPWMLWPPTALFLVLGVITILAASGAYFSASVVFVVFMTVGVSQAGGMFIVVMTPSNRASGSSESAG